VSVLVWQHSDQTPLAADQPEDLAIAALLHDVAEDAGGQAALGELRALFGERVAQIVALASDALPEPGKEKPPWRPRKEAHIARVRRVARGDEELGLLPDPGAALVIACDKLDNLRATVDDLAREGEEAFARFNGGPDGTRWYYRAMRDALSPALPSALVRRIDELLIELERVRD
jgi:(p)ppGpp synthase/HD superfamily hydrolase